MWKKENKRQEQLQLKSRCYASVESAFILVFIHCLSLTQTGSTDINTWKALDSNRLSMNYKFMEIHGFRRNSIQ